MIKGNDTGSESGQQGAPADQRNDTVLEEEIVQIPRLVAIRCLDQEIVRRISTKQELARLPDRVSEKLSGREERTLTQQARLWLSRRVKNDWQFDPHAEYGPGVHGSVAGTRWTIRRAWFEGEDRSENKYTITVPRWAVTPSYTDDIESSDGSTDQHSMRPPKRRRLSSRPGSRYAMSILQGPEHWARQRDAWTQAEHHRISPVKATSTLPPTPLQSSPGSRLPLTTESSLQSAIDPSTEPRLPPSCPRRITLLPVPSSQQFIPDNPIRDFRHSAKNNATIYDAMVVHEKPPWAPIPLGRMISALVQGWKADGTWTGAPAVPLPQAALSLPLVPRESPIAHRKPRKEVRAWVRSVMSESVGDPEEAPIRLGQGKEEARVGASGSMAGGAVRTKADRLARPTVASMGRGVTSAATGPAVQTSPKERLVVEDSEPLDEGPHEVRPTAQKPAARRRAAFSGGQAVKPVVQGLAEGRTKTKTKKGAGQPAARLGVKTRARAKLEEADGMDLVGNPGELGGRKRSLGEVGVEERVGRMENRLNSLSFEG